MKIETRIKVGHEVDDFIRKNKIKYFDSMEKEVVDYSKISENYVCFEKVKFDEFIKQLVDFIEKEER